MTIGCSEMAICPVPASLQEFPQLKGVMETNLIAWALQCHSLSCNCTIDNNALNTHKTAQYNSKTTLHLQKASPMFLYWTPIINDLT